MAAFYPCNTKFIFGSNSNTPLLDLLQAGVIDTSDITNLYGAFIYAGQNDIHLEPCDFTNAQDWGYAFDHAKAEYIYFGDYTFANAQYMSYMFENCPNLKRVYWDKLATTQALVSVRNMFRYCYALESVDVSGINYSSVTTSRNQFCQCKSLAKLDLSGAVTNNNTDMGYMFYAFGRNVEKPKIWVPSTFVATAVTNSSNKPFVQGTDEEGYEIGHVKVYTDATDANTQGWGAINNYFDIHYNSTHEEYEVA